MKITEYQVPITFVSDIVQDFGKKIMGMSQYKCSLYEVCLFTCCKFDVLNYQEPVIIINITLHVVKENLSHFKMT